MLSFRNKKGDIESIMYVIAILFLTGFILVFFSDFALDIYTRLETGIDNAGYNNTEADTAINKAQTTEGSIWDYVFLAIAISYVISMLILAYSTQINPIFYFIYGIIAALGLFLGIALANLWEALASNAAMTDVISRFPITNLILDNYYPMFITVIILSVMVLLFGKFTNSGSSGGLG